MLVFMCELVEQQWMTTMVGCNLKLLGSSGRSSFLLRYALGGIASAGVPEKKHGGNIGECAQGGGTRRERK